MNPAGRMRPISPRKVLSLLLAVIGVLVLASLATQVLRFHLGHDYAKGLVPAFFVDRENNVPTWFSTILLFLCAILLAVIAAARHAAGDRFARHWTVLAGGFVLMSLDEAAGIHELLIQPMRQTLEAGGAFYFSWIIAGMGLVALLGLYFLRFVIELEVRWRRLFLAAAALYLGGALGLEMVGGAWVDARGFDNFTYTLIALAEETLEMLGASLFVYGLLAFIAAERREVRVPLGTETERPRQRAG